MLFRSTRYGMSKKFGLMGLATVESQYLEGRTALNCSDATAAQIDAEVVEILKGSYDKALELIRENRGVMDKLAEFLIEKETITGKEFMQIFRREKGLPEPEETESGEAESGGPGQAAGKEGRDGEAAKGQEAAAAPARETAGEKAAAVPGAEPASEADADAEKAEESRRNPEPSDSAEGDGDARQPQPAARAEAPVEEPQGAPAQESAGNAVPQPRESAPRPEQSAWTGGKEAPEQVSQAEASGEQESDARPVGRFSNGRIE